MAETRNWKLRSLTGEQVESLTNQLLKSAVTMTLAGKNETVVNETLITHLVFEQYFMRNSSYACLSVELVRTAEQTLISAISAGGSQSLLNVDWGSSNRMLDKIDVALKQL